MNSDEFNDLEKFGKVIENTPKKESVKVKKKEKTQLKISIKGNGFKFVKKGSDLVRYLSYKSKILLFNINNFLKKKKEIRKRYRTVLKRNRKKKNIGYKIVETKKQRGNKTIIIRKRVPSFFDDLDLSKQSAPMANMYYLSSNENTDVKNEPYTILKKSVWDFPVEDKSIFSRSINTLKIQRLFKK